jgi:transposase
MRKGQEVSALLAPPFQLASERLGPLPLVNEFIAQLELPRLLERYVPTPDRRCRLPYGKALGVLLRSILIEREPIYRHEALVQSFAPALFGVQPAEAQRLCDDTLGRALDQLFLADRAALLTDVVVTVSRRFAVRLDELHNDSTTVQFAGQYRAAAHDRRRWGKRTAWITYGFSKDHRPDLKQLLFILTTSADGGVPVQFRCADGNTNDSITHIESWEALRQAAGRADFLYVADCKLCSYENTSHIDRHGGRFVTVMPRSRKEDEWFRRWVQTHEVPWEPVWDRPNPRRHHGPRDRWYAYRSDLPSQEGWPVVWVYSTLLALSQRQRRLEHLQQATEELADLDRRLQGPRPRRRVRHELAQQVQEILERLSVADYLRVEFWTEERHRFRQEHRGRAGANTRYRRDTRRRIRLRWTLQQERIDYDQKTDGMYPLLTNDRNLTPRQVLEAHKRQPCIEKRFEQLKNVHEIAPVFLKSETRIEAFFFLYFLALLLQALVERQLRQGMQRAGIEQLPLYPEERNCRRPTFLQLLRLFSLAERHVLRKDHRIVQLFPPQLNDLQRQVLRLLGVPAERYLAAP